MVWGICLPFQFGLSLFKNITWYIVLLVSTFYSFLCKLLNTQREGIFCFVPLFGWSRLTDNMLFQTISLRSILYSFQSLIPFISAIKHRACSFGLDSRETIYWAALPTEATNRNARKKYKSSFKPQISGILVIRGELTSKSSFLY